MNKLSRQSFEETINQLLKPDSFQDYCPNGLQVEGSKHINRIATAVSASLETIELAARLEVDALLTHHGMFWQKDSYPITGSKKHKIQLLLDKSINLFAYHLPLDCHAEIGNNALIGKLLGCESVTSISPSLPNILLAGELASGFGFAELREHLHEVFQFKPIGIEAHSRPIKKLAWCSGAGESFFAQSVAAGADVFITGELSEKMVHLAKESECHFFACGHHATETHGIKALGNYLAEKHDLEHIFINIPTPV